MLRVIRHDEPAARAVLDRSAGGWDEGVDEPVRAILADVRARGDAAVREYTERFDRRAPGADGTYRLPRARWDALAAETAPDVRAALERAADRIRAFHERQVEPDVELVDGGARLELRARPLARVGIYVPGGTARYPSSVLMTAIPARVAGVGEIVMVTPGPSAETLYAAAIAGVGAVFELGGAQAVGSLAFGTASVPRVDKIVGPGNKWVAAAKRQVFGVVDIDAVAGPSEVLIVADDTAEAAWVAADLLAQAEHDEEARAVVVTPSAALAAAIAREVDRQLATLPRRDIARRSIEHHGAAIVVPDLDRAIAFAEEFAPEHLELQCAGARDIAARVTCAGAIFVGPWASEAAGDYLAGPNHVLPTLGTARWASPLGVYDFRKRTSVIEYDAAAAAAAAADIELLAGVEGLDAHGRSAAMRRDALPERSDGLAIAPPAEPVSRG
jgi:histidinol dehydrogenase